MPTMMILTAMVVFAQRQSRLKQLCERVMYMGQNLKQGHHVFRKKLIRIGHLQPPEGGGMGIPPSI